MSDKRPNVFPTQEQINQANQLNQQPAQPISQQQLDFEELERLRTQEQIRLRDEAINKTKSMAYEGQQMREAMILEDQANTQRQQPPVVPPTVPPSNNNNNNYNGGNNNGDNKRNSYIEELSQPQMNQPYDILPLPSEGKLYRSKKKAVKVAYLTTADENILTSPNLVESGDFLEILINRKLLEPDLRYKDLLPGDRNAIMLWLRATGYGEMYPVTIYDKKGDPFDTEINLSELKTIKLTVEPDSDGLYEFELPLSKHKVRFKVLTIGDLEELEKLAEVKKSELINVEQTLILERQVVEIDGNKDRTFINDFVNNMRILDAQKLREYIKKIDSGIDMTITVRTPGGESITTFLPLTPKFFWPNFEL